MSAQKDDPSNYIPDCIAPNHLRHSAPIRPALAARAGGGAGSENVVPGDPNNMIGPAGYGTAGYITPGQTLPYTIEFENEPTASAPAQNVVVTEQLSPNLNWSTFQFGTIGFGDYAVTVPAGVINSVPRSMLRRRSGSLWTSQPT